MCYTCLVRDIGLLVSVSNPLHILQEYLLTAAVIQFRVSAVGMAGGANGGAVNRKRKNRKRNLDV